MIDLLNWFNLLIHRWLNIQFFYFLYLLIILYIWVDWNRQFLFLIQFFIDIHLGQFSWCFRQRRNLIRFLIGVFNFLFQLLMILYYFLRNFILQWIFNLFNFLSLFFLNVIFIWILIRNGFFFDDRSNYFFLWILSKYFLLFY